ncbi:MULTISPECIES: sensor histidine kinase [Flavobacterium]|jgi:two-component system sensor histidine kinase ArlS|uniref:histidine kinase n=2 Tax=Flavobacterium TaxID=237 RepID=A0A482THY6_9FLAO|nr:MULTISPECIES: HAMP domain-containing sensor histidine kinase [Flavobacterium]PIF63046.1 signal transduction histidine kinase [Flavobacterium sp. 11]RBN48933.1 sensor histidine kinase [Flavobacterium psychrolimnae]RYJ50727.1 HAMP domain-containing histidine kinase [Flavobacterium petrolei]WKL45183.1 HAMP domain-containing sensor histidine kinase [Flavobacterium sp. ZE23DGlu08]
MEQVINGKMNKKLLQKTLNYYFIYALVILITVGPVFYIISNILYEDDANEDLYAIKKQFDKFTKDDLTIMDITLWNKFNRDVNLEKFNGIQKDSLFDHSYYDALTKENEPFRVLNAPVKIEGKWFTFSAKINMVEKENLIGSTVILFISLLVLLIIGFFIITKIISKKLWQPFYAALDKMEQFEIDKSTSVKLIKNTTEEFNRLNSAIDSLIHKNSSIYQSQREFIENAAHELQTPIAIFKGKLENILQRNDLNSEQFKLIDDLNNTTTRLVKLNKNLLVLSKIDSNSYNEIEKINIKDIINNQLTFFNEQALSKKIDITTELSNEVEAKSNHFLAEMIISNLFLNTINHNVLNGQVIIKLTNHSITFANTGILIALQTEKMFERFSKSNPSSQGNGLGLSIIKKIADTNHWSVNYYFMDRMHKFEIVF